jgi:DNA-binding transcriptional LysR family regulator
MAVVLCVMCWVLLCRDGRAGRGSCRRTGDRAAGIARGYRDVRQPPSAWLLAGIRGAGAGRRAWCDGRVELREVRAFVAVAEEGGLSAAARRVHVSQSALSQTIRSLERELGVPLLVRRSTGTELTSAGRVLLGEARELLARHDRAVAAVVGAGTGAAVLRLGVPLELPADLLPPALTTLRESLPDVRVQVRHLSTAEQVAELRTRRLDVALVRERPPGPQFDALLVATERLGVLLSDTVAGEVAGPDGVRLDQLGGLTWIGFPRAESPSWYDQVVAVLRGHGVVVDQPTVEDESLIAEVKVAAVQTGRTFTLAPGHWSQPLPEGVGWYPLVGAPLVRMTWAVWAADTRRRDVGVFIASLEPQRR